MGLPSALALVVVTTCLASPALGSAQVSDRLGDPELEEIPPGDVGIVTEQTHPSPRPRWSYGLTLGYASLGALGGTGVGGIVGTVIGIEADDELGDGGVPLAVGTAIGVGFALGVPIVLAVLDAAEPTGGDPWWALLGSVVAVALGFGVGALIGAVAPDGSQGITPALFTGGVIGTTLSPVAGALAFWLSQPRRVPSGDDGWE